MALFGDRVHTHRNRTAVVGAQGDWTYEELDRRSDEIASALSSAGVLPGARVGVVGTREPLLVAALVGVWKAQAVYVPLDPVFPSERTSAIELSAGLSALLRVIDGEIEIEPRPAPANTPWSGYVIYTSGSTGRPKGVPIRRQQVGQLLNVLLPKFDFGVDDVWPLMHSYSFDVSVWEIWASLCSGGTLTIPSHQTLLSPDATVDFLARNGVTVLNAVPSVFGQLVAALEDRDATLPLIRHVLFAGEAMKVDTVMAWRRLGSQAAITNLYGLTEATIHTTFRRISHDEPLEQKRTPIGRPLDGLDALVVDEDLRPVPEGSEGELLLTGPQVFAGYDDAPAVTKERLVTIDGRLWYRTGDIVTHEDDMRYLRRNDDQVQLRGFRVELGEIEAAASRVRDVSATAACIVETFGGPQVGLAVTLRPGNSTSLLDELREHLATVLPSYMRPYRIVAVDAMPLTPSGKLNRNSVRGLFIDN